jgi:hypothetical protein
MICPKCGGASFEMIGPAAFRCTGTLYGRVPVPPPIGMPFALTYQDVAYPCRYEYFEGNAPEGQAACPEHGLFPFGMCGDCRSTAVCGRCGRGKCLTCRTRDEAAEAEAYRARQEAEQAARQAKEAEHAAAVAENTANQPKSQQQYLAELRILDRELGELRPKLRTSITKFSPGYAVSGIVGLAFWIVALIIIVKTPVKIISLFPLGIGLAFMYPIILWMIGISRESKEGVMQADRNLLLLELGCGEECEYGCRRY